MDARQHFSDATNRPGASATPERLISHRFSRAAVAFLTAKLGLSGSLHADPRWGFLFWKNQDGRKFSVSLAHTADAVCAIVSASAVGVDIETESRSVDRLASRLYTEFETQWSTEMGIPRIHVWCAKEAVLKALGTGIQGGLKKIELHPLDVNRGLYAVQSVVPPVTSERLEPLCVRVEIWKSFVVAAAGSRTALGAGVRWLG